MSDNPVTEDGGQFIIRSELMQDYTVSSPYQSDTGEPMVASVRDGNGVVQIFSMGTDKDIYNIYRESSTQSGWSFRKLCATEEIKSFAVGTDIRGAVVVFAVGEDNHLYYRSDEPWSEWTDLGNPFGASAVLKSVRVGRDNTGNLLAMAVASFPLDSSDTTPSADAVVRIYWRDPEPSWTYVSPFIELASDRQIDDCVPACADGATNGCFVSINETPDEQTSQAVGLSFFREGRRIFRTYESPTIQRLTALNGVVTSTGDTELFALDADGNGYYIDQTAPSGLSSFVQLTFQTDAPPKLVCIRGGIDSRSADGDTLEVFALGSDGNLYHARQQRQATPSEGEYSYTSVWPNLIALTGTPDSDGEQVLLPYPDNLTICQDEQGCSQGFSVAGGGLLINFTQNENDEWTLAPVITPFKGKLSPAFPCYATDISYAHADGTAIPYQRLRIATSVDTRVNINGKAYPIGPDNPVACLTNAAGRVTVNVPTGTLGTPSLTVSGASLAEGDVLAIRPDQNTQSALYPSPTDTQSGAKILASQISAAMVDAGLPPPPPDDLDSASEAIWSSASLATLDPGDPTLNAQFISRRGDQLGVRIMHGADAAQQVARISPAQVPTQHWMCENSNGRIIFHRFADHAAAMQTVADMRTELTHDPSYALKIGKYSIHEPDWGDVWDGVKRGVATVTKIVVSTVETEIESIGETIVSEVKSVMEFVLDGVKYVVDYGVDVIEQAFDIIQGAFDWLGIDFTNLFLWLGEQFDWTNILTVKQFLSGFLQDTFEILPTRIANSEKVVDECFARLQESLGVWPESLGKLSDRSPASTAEQVYDDDNDKAPGPSSNWLQSKLLDGMESITGAPLAPNNFDGLLNPLEDFAGVVLHDIEGVLKDFIEKVRAVIEAALGHGTYSLANLTVGELMGVVEKLVASELLGIVQEVTDATFALVRELSAAFLRVLDQVWEIPIISQLYRDITNGDELSLLDLISLILALPTYLAMKLLYAGDTSWLVSLTRGSGSSRLAVPDATSACPTMLTTDSNAKSYAVGWAFSGAIAANMLFKVAAAAKPKIPVILQGHSAVIGGVQLVAETLGVLCSGTVVALSCDFIGNTQMTKSNKVFGVAYVVSCLQWLLVDFTSLGIDVILKSSIAWAEREGGLAYEGGTSKLISDIQRGVEAGYDTSYLEGRLSEIKSVEKPLLRSLRAICNYGIGPALSVLLMGLFLLQGYEEWEEVGSGDGTDNAKFLVFVKFCQNLLMCLDDITVLFELGEKMPAFKAEVGVEAKTAHVASVLASDGGALVINSARIMSSRILGIPHKNR